MHYKHILQIYFLTKQENYLKEYQIHVNLCVSYLERPSHPRVRKLLWRGRKGFSPFSYISQAASSNTRFRRELGGLVLTNAHFNLRGNKVPQQKAPAWCTQKGKKKSKPESQGQSIAAEMNCKNFLPGFEVFPIARLLYFLVASDIVKHSHKFREMPFISNPNDLNLGVGEARII